MRKSLVMHDSVQHHVHQNYEYEQSSQGWKLWIQYNTKMYIWHLDKTSLVISFRASLVLVHDLSKHQMYLVVFTDSLILKDY